jgi:DNA-binding transcriptional ArsR family regulator
MDILDIAILSLLQIKKFSLDEISTNISKYTLSEIHRSLFALLVMGLITVERERAKEMNSVAAIIRRTLNQKSTRSLLHKLINSIKSK